MPPPPVTLWWFALPLDLVREAGLPVYNTNTVSFLRLMGRRETA